MKKLLLLLILMILLPARKVGAQTLDIYGGYSAVPCTSGGNWAIVKINNHMFQCDPLGHVWFGKSIDVLAPTAGNDQFGHDAAYYAYNSGTPKYPSAATYFNVTAGQVISWGMNGIGSSAHSGFYPVTTDSSYPGDHSLPNKMPFLISPRTCLYDEVLGVSVQYGLLTSAIKNVYYGVSPIYTAVGGYMTAAGVCDYDDPGYYTVFDAQFTHTPVSTWLASSYNHYLNAVVGEETDQTYGYNGGYDFETTPASHGQPHISMIVSTGSPVQTGNATQSYSTFTGAIYSDYFVHQKLTWMNMMITKYTTIAALNTAWATSGYYTTFGTSGKCWGVAGHFSSMTCGSAGAAVATTGSGAGPYTVTLSGAVSKHSVAVWVGSTMECGDTGAGAWGSANTQAVRCTAGSVNYSTGAVTITFNTTPASAPTIEYIQNGWGAGGTGLMDEDANNATSQGWWGTCSNLNFASKGSCNLSAYGGMNANLKTDEQNFEYQLAKNFLTQQQTIVATYAPWAFYVAPFQGSWGTVPDCQISQAVGQYSNIYSVANPSPTQAMLDFVQSCAGDVAMELGQFRTSNEDSEFGFQHVSVTHSGTTVTATAASGDFFLIGGNPANVTGCSDSTYNASGVTLSGTQGGTTLTYTRSPAPTGASAAGCLIAYVSSNAAGNFATHDLMGADFKSGISVLFSTAFTADGVKPYVGYDWWQFYPNYQEYNAFGLLSIRGNAYNGVEDVTATVTCSAPVNAYSCGGELQTYGDVITSVKAANAILDNDIINPGLPAPPTNLTISVY